MNNQIVYYPVIDKVRDKWKLYLSQIQDQIKNSTIENLMFTDDIEQSNVILVWWWDWFLLKSLRKYYKYKKIFYGINCGTVWFLLNQIDNIWNLPTSLDQIQTVSDSFIDFHGLKTDGTFHQQFVINDVIIWSSITWMNYFTLDDWESVQKIEWTWLLISSAIGCTGYNAANHWPYIKFDDEEWIASWLACGKFRSAVLPKQDYKVQIQSREPVNAYIDWQSICISDLQSFTIRKSNVYIQIGFNNLADFMKRRRKLYNEKFGWC